MIQVKINRLMKDMNRISESIRKCNQKGNIIKSDMLKQRLEFMEEALEQLKAIV